MQELSHYKKNKLKLMIYLIINFKKIINPIQVEYKRSLGEAILILISLGACLFSSLIKRSPKPLNKVDPPDNTIFWNKCFLKSISDFRIELARIS